MRIDISGIPKHILLACLVNEAKSPSGNPELQEKFQALGIKIKTPAEITPKKSREILETRAVLSQEHGVDVDLYFDMLFGRKLYINLTSDTELRCADYDAANTEGAAERAVAQARELMHSCQVAESTESDVSFRNMLATSVEARPGLISK